MAFQSKKFTFVLYTIIVGFFVCGKFLAIINLGSVACKHTHFYVYTSTKMNRNYFFKARLLNFFWNEVNCQCPQPWTKLANRRWYLLAEEKRVTFKEAKAYCKEQGGYVVDISSESEYITLSIKLGKQQIYMGELIL